MNSIICKSNTAFVLVAFVAILSGCAGGGSDAPVAAPTVSAPPPPPPASNNAPTISGTPGASVAIGNTYTFSPTASDPDNDPLTFTVQNKPTWAGFNSSTGELSGTPLLGDVGNYAGIVISVSDGVMSANLPQFSLEVASSPTPPPPPPPPPPPSNNPPIISGTPGTSVLIDDTYVFVPTASDPDGDTLAFTVQNKPAWAGFNSATGALSGTPSLADIGTYTGISITVNDGQIAVRLSSFTVDVVQNATGSITVSWTPPTQNEDGTALTDLAAYNLYYGTTSGSYPNQIHIDNPGLTSFVIENLVPGTYFVVGTAINSSDEESRFSGEARKEAL